MRPLEILDFLVGAGSTIDIRMVMIAMTTSSSTSVSPAGPPIGELFAAFICHHPFRPTARYLAAACCGGSL